MNIKEKLEGVKKLLFGAEDAAPTEAQPANPPAQVVSYNVENGNPVFVNIADDGVEGIDAEDKVYADKELTAPYPDGTYKVTGTEFSFTVIGGVVSAVDDAAGTGAGTPIQEEAAPVVEPSQPDLSTPEQMLSATEKFGVGTPEERLDRIELMVKALMENCFGWQIREAKEKAIRDSAIAQYQQGFDAQKAENEALKTRLDTQKEAFAKLMEIVDAIAETSTAAPVEKPKDSFQKDQFEKKEGKAFGIGTALKAIRN